MLKPLNNNLRDLEEIWYAKLKESGFDDIENTSNPDRPLKKWHNLYFVSESAQRRREQAEKYYKQIEVFNNYDEVYEICCLIAKHGHSTLWPEDVKDILDLHQEGLSERKIAERVNRGKKCVHLTLKKAREWMKVI